MNESVKPLRDPQPLLDKALRDWGGHSDLWIFGYASLIWRPDFEFAERRPARVHGWHRALKMWSRINRGTPERPGLVFGMLSGGCCRGVVFRIAREQGAATLASLWGREMAMAVYDPRWLTAHTPQGPVRALAFTLSRKSPSHTGELTEEEYRAIFAFAAGIYGTTRDYVQAHAGRTAAPQHPRPRPGAPAAHAGPPPRRLSSGPACEPGQPTAQPGPGRARCRYR